LVHETVVRLDLNGQAAASVRLDEARQEELALIEGLRNGAESAYEKLIAMYQQPVYNLVYRLLNDPCDGCDVVQEVFVKIFRNIKAFRGQSSLKTWVYRIALNEAHNRRRWFGRHKRHEVDLERDDAMAGLSLQDTLPDSGSSPFELALSVEAQKLIEEALQALSPSFREAVVLRDVEELSYEEIADVLGINIGTVKSRILRGREALRKEMATRMGEETSSRAPGGRATSVFNRLLPGVRTVASRGMSGD
jgi:RNA polymerase sigma-70 factor (ECF subfamily)